MTHLRLDQESMRDTPTIPLACPACRKPLAIAGTQTTCPTCRQTYTNRDRIWRLLRPDREEYFARWIEQYDCIRRHERRGDPNDPERYRVLPFALPDDPCAGEWAIRSRTYRLLMARLDRWCENPRRKPLRILDLGAGNCWLSHRLSRLGHELCAIDLRVDSADGLGAARHYQPVLGRLFPRCQAEFDALPFLDDAFDLIVFNASFHYSTNYGTTLNEALRVLRVAGRLVILDSPVYRDDASGRRMMSERRDHFTGIYGFPSDSLPTLGYLTYDGLRSLGARLGLEWEHAVPWYGSRWALKPWLARLLGRRQPAQFGLWIGRPR